MTRGDSRKPTEKIIMEYSNPIVATVIVITAMATVMSAGVIIAASRTGRHGGDRDHGREGKQKA
ncbi:MAG TPA: hypothetical protein VN283_13330 [Thiobacillus sp.]|nr:hypothetical protein [Thiobacillus sp.]